MMSGSAPVLEKITQQTFRASEIVNGLLNFSRTGGTEFTSVDLNDLLHDTVTLLEHQLKTAQIRVETDLDPDLARIHGNQGKLQQVMLNLLLNAKDAMFGTADATLEDCDLQTDRAVWWCGFRTPAAASSRSICTASTIRSSRPRPSRRTVQHKGTGLGTGG